ncbi:MAG: rRNA maturation RNAse YbeY [Candidatus Peribacteria bacterium]|nr:rRNA maturation RNAse YbeY [Candidatus Peribacteria bacterium]
MVFLDDDSIQILNKKYRNIDYSTDVLSFHYFYDFSLLNKEEIV